MAIRVVQDLGMQHEISLAPRGEGGGAATGGLGESQLEEIARRRLLFWSVFLMDRFISWGVGLVLSFIFSSRIPSLECPTFRRTNENCVKLTFRPPPFFPADGKLR